MAEGVRTTDFPLVEAADELIVNDLSAGGSTGRLPVANLAEQLAADGPISDRLDEIEDLALAGARSPVTVRVIATANVALSNGLENGDTVDGVVLATGDVVVLAGQTDPIQNGAYVVVASGVASRDPRYDSGNELAGVQFAVLAGTRAGQVWAVRGQPVINTDPISITYAFPLNTNADGSITNPKLASMAAGTIKMRLPGTAGAPTDETIATLGGLIGGVLGIALWEVVTDSPYYSDRAYVLDQDGAKRTVWARRISDGSIVWFSELDAGVTEVIQARGQHAKLNDRLSAMGEWISVPNSEFFVAYWYVTDEDGNRRATRAIRRVDGLIIDFGSAPVVIEEDVDPDPTPSAGMDFSACVWPVVHRATTALSSPFLPFVPNSVFSYWLSNPVETAEWGWFSSVSTGQAATGMPKMRQISQFRKIPATAPIEIETVRIGWDASITGDGAYNDDHNGNGNAVNPRWNAKYTLASLGAGHNQASSRSVLQLSKSGDARGLSSDLNAISQVGEITYSVAYRNASVPNLIYMLRRVGTSGRYSLVIFDDLTETVVAEYNISGQGGQIYNLVRPCADGSGLWFLWYRNPGSQGDDDNFASIMKMTWDVRWVSVDGTQIADIKTFNANTFNPIVAGDLVVPTAFGDRMRLYDMREFTTGVISVAWAWWTGAAVSGTQATNYIMRFNTATPSVRMPVKVGANGAGGIGINDTTNYHYFGGSCFVKPDILLTAAWSGTGSTVDTWNLVPSVPVLKANLEVTTDRCFRPQCSTAFAWSQIVERIIPSIGSFAVYNKGPTYDSFATQDCGVQPLLTATL